MLMHPEHPNWRIDSELGLGTFSKVFSAIDVVSSKPVAIKYPRDSCGAALLENEAKIMASLVKCECKFHLDVPKLLDASQCPKFIVMERVGQSILQLLGEKPHFPLKTVLLVGLKTLDALESIHKCGIVHRDVKPDNIATALALADSKLYLIDVGLSYAYMRGNMHVSYSETEDFRGTPFFCSTNSLKGVKCTRRDDLESLGYVLVYLAAGQLPWFQVPYPSRDALKNILYIREKVGINKLCKGLDSAFREFLTYCQGLKFEEKPNYKHLRSLLVSAALRAEIHLNDGLYDWSPRPHHSSRPKLTRSTTAIKPHLHSRKRPSMHLSQVSFDLPLPTQKRRHSKRVKKQAKLNLSATASTADGSPDEDLTPKCGVDKLPKFRWPRPKHLVESGSPLS